MHVTLRCQLQRSYWYLVCRHFYVEFDYFCRTLFTQLQTAYNQFLRIFTFYDNEECRKIKMTICKKEVRLLVVLVTVAVILYLTSKWSPLLQSFCGYFISNVFSHRWMVNNWFLSSMEVKCTFQKLRIWWNDFLNYLKFNQNSINLFVIAFAQTFRASYMWGVRNFWILGDICSSLFN